MSKLTAQGSIQNKLFKPKIYEVKNYYNQGNYQNRYRSNRGDRRMSFTGRAEYGQNYTEGCNMLIIIEMT